MFVGDMKGLLHYILTSSVAVDKLQAIWFLICFDVFLCFFLGYL